MDFIYISLLEMLELLKDFDPRIAFCWWFIDDGVSIWITTQPGSAQA